MSTFWIGTIVTESATFPLIVPVIAAAGVAGIARPSSRERATSVEVAARRKSLELIGNPSSRKRRGCGGGDGNWGGFFGVRRGAGWGKREVLGGARSFIKKI